MRHFHVKGWRRFQHYGDRTPPWVKLYNSLLEDFAFAGLSDAAKFHLIGIWLLASRTANVIPDDPQFVAHRLNAKEPVDLELLASHGFLESCDGSDPLACGESRCPQGATKTLDQSKRENKRKNRNPLPPCSNKNRLSVRVPSLAGEQADGFGRFWIAYPRKQGKGAAERVFARVNPSAELLARILAAIETQKGTDQWRKDSGRFIPYPGTWLNQGRWEDEITPATEEQLRHVEGSGPRRTFPKAQVPY